MVGGICHLVKMKMMQFTLAHRSLDRTEATLNLVMSEKSVSWDRIRLYSTHSHEVGGGRGEGGSRGGE